MVTGIAVNALTGALIAILIFLGNTQSREQVVFWQMGSLTVVAGALLTVCALALTAVQAMISHIDVLS